MYDFVHVYTRGMKLSIIHVLKFNSWLVVCTNPMVRTWSLCCDYFDMNLRDSIMKTSNFWKKTKLILILCGLHMSSELTTTGHPLLGFMYIWAYFTPIIRNLKVRVLVLIQGFENTEVSISELLMSFPSWVSPSWCKVTEVMGLEHLPFQQGKWRFSLYSVSSSNYLSLTTLVSGDNHSRKGVWKRSVNSSFLYHFWSIRSVVKRLERWLSG